MTDNYYDAFGGHLHKGFQWTHQPDRRQFCKSQADNFVPVIPVFIPNKILVLERNFFSCKVQTKLRKIAVRVVSGEWRMYI